MTAKGRRGGGEAERQTGTGEVEGGEGVSGRKEVKGLGINGSVKKERLRVERTCWR